jgi:hypothetical protein
MIILLLLMESSPSLTFCGILANDMAHDIPMEVATSKSTIEVTLTLFKQDCRQVPYFDLTVDQCKYECVKNCNGRGFGCSEYSCQDSANHYDQEKQAGNSIEKFEQPAVLRLDFSPTG